MRGHVCPIGAALLLCAIPRWVYAQPPAITQEGVRNAASQVPPSLPGGALAPGALFVIQGLRLAGANSETRVHIRQGDADVEAQVISAGAERIEARMPASAPAGNSQLVVTRGGQSSRPFPLRVAPCAFGIFSRNGRGWGTGEILNDDGEANTRARPAQPGATATLVGTGWGTARSAEVFVGEKRARLLSRRPKPDRPGVDEIRFQLASDTPLGCYVPLVLRLPGGSSNVVTLSVAAKDQPCPGVAPGTAVVLLARLNMRVRLSTGLPVSFTQDIGAATFPAGDGPDAALTFQEMVPPAGTCTGFTGRLFGDSLAAVATEFPPFFGVPERNGGPGITVSGPNGAATLRPSSQARGAYVAALGGGVPLRAAKPPFLDPGEYRIRGQGGPDIGEFTAEARYNSPVEWVQSNRLETVDRARGVTLKWRGVNPHELVMLVASSVDPLSGATGVCLCLAPGSAGRWRLPALLLSKLPASRIVAGAPRSYLLMATLPAVHPTAFSTRGLKSGIIVFTTVRGRTVQYR